MLQHTKRLRDPVHGLIVFDMNDEIDRVAWSLIDTPEFQRLRRVKQLGLSELTFPGATHNRFSHSIGVFHLARQLMNVAKPILKAENRWRDQRGRVALLAALLHDIGHGPFSHAFEMAEQERFKSKPGTYRNHEFWTAEIIKSREGQIRSTLEKHFESDGAIADDIANLLTSNPTDIYSAVVSSSFDADRLDYLQRDKLMTGSGAGGIDFDWLKDNLRIAKVKGETEGASSGAIEVETFCFTEKALQAAESFLLARYHLFSQVYCHKTTRGFERLLTAFLQRLHHLVSTKQTALAGLSETHPLVMYFDAETPNLLRYIKLDDAIVWAAIEVAAEAEDERLKELAVRLRDRKPMKPIEIDVNKPTNRDKSRRKKIDELLKSDGGKAIFSDRPKLTVYADHTREAVPLHKRVHIKRNDGSVADIVGLSPAIGALALPQEILRYYFLDETVRESVLKIEG